jgi:hypothetical protein
MPQVGLTQYTKSLYASSGLARYIKTILAVPDLIRDQDRHTRQTPPVYGYITANCVCHLHGLVRYLFECARLSRQHSDNRHELPFAFDGPQVCRVEFEQGGLIARNIARKVHVVFSCVFARPNQSRLRRSIIWNVIVPKAHRKKRRKIRQMRLLIRTPKRDQIS